MNFLGLFLNGVRIIKVTRHMERKEGTITSPWNLLKASRECSYLYLRGVGLFQGTATQRLEETMAVLQDDDELLIE